MERRRAVAGEDEDEGLWRLPRSELLLGDGKGRTEAARGNRGVGHKGHAVAQRLHTHRARVD